MSNYDPNRWGNNYGQQPQQQLPPYGMQPQPYGYQQPYNPLTNGIIRPPEGKKTFGIVALSLAFLNLLPAIILIVVGVIMLNDVNAINFADPGAETALSIYVIFVTYVVPLAAIVGIVFAILAIAQRKGRMFGVASIIVGALALLLYVVPFFLLYAILAGLGS